MDVKSLLYIVVFTALVTSCSAVCEVNIINYDHCNYTVACIGNPSSVGNPTCEVEPYVIFTMTASRLEYLTTAFFAATNFDSRVREFIAHGNTWPNIESSGLRYYTKSVRVDISNNGIVNIKNEAFRHLNYLLYLNMSNNLIETLYPKSFLISDSRSSLVQELDLSHNKLLQLSSELNELSNLKRLHLQDNLLLYLADDAFMNLKSLEYLNLQNNRLSSLNLTLTNLKMLKTLDVSHNNLIKLLGYEINRLVAIVDFNASHNALTLIDSNCFNQAFSLQRVDFSNNNIKINIESVMFINNNQLMYLNFNNNAIMGIQDNAFKYCILDYINLENNNISVEIKENTFTGLSNVIELDLSRQSVKGIGKKAFVEMKNLHNLNLSSNNIAIIDNSSFINTSISVLDISYNNVPNLNFLHNCLTNLTELYLNNNNITLVPRNSFINQTQLKKLDLSINKIITIQEYSIPLNNLQYLNITGNRLNGVIRKNIFSPAKYLRFLDLSNFSITNIDDSAFVDLTVLARLNLSNNQIASINPNNFMGADNMYSLDISNNNLTNLTFDFSILTNLKALYLKNNNLTYLPKLSKKWKLLYLDVSKNNISNITGIGADIFPNLTVLYLDNNEIETFNNPKINTLTTLIDLQLSCNKIRNVNLSYFTELMSVNLSNNNLTVINSSLFEKNEYLQSLDISKNFIMDLPPGTFQFMRNLKLLNLSSNFLTKLRYGSLNGLHKTEVLDLSRNNIGVLDVDVFHECVELKTLIIDYNRIKTFDVERLILMSLRKLRTLSLGGNPISCKEIVHNMKSVNVTFYAIRQVEVTSLDKIYHEDNVHGIKCGEDEIINKNTTVKSNLPVSEASSLSSSYVVLIWCSLLTILLIVAGVVMYIKKYKKRSLLVNSNMTLHMRSSLESDGSHFQNDLLG